MTCAVAANAMLSQMTTAINQVLTEFFCILHLPARSEPAVGFGARDKRLLPSCVSCLLGGPKSGGGSRVRAGQSRLARERGSRRPVGSLPLRNLRSVKVARRGLTVPPVA